MPAGQLPEQKHQRNTRASDNFPGILVRIGLPSEVASSMINKTLTFGLIFSAALSACADVGTVANKIDPNTEAPKYLMLTCQDTATSACRLGIGAPVDPKADSMNASNNTRTSKPAQN